MGRSRSPEFPLPRLDVDRAKAAERTLDALRRLCTPSHSRKASAPPARRAVTAPPGRLAKSGARPAAGASWGGTAAQETDGRAARLFRSPDGLRVAEHESGLLERLVVRGGDLPGVPGGAPRRPGHGSSASRVRGTSEQGRRPDAWSRRRPRSSAGTGRTYGCAVELAPIRRPSSRPRTRSPRELD